ncbi:MAG: hypothetical protein LBI95_02570 [Holosporales bacterium]|nr:hypothetical protein [Holosporales bacterium]
MSSALTDHFSNFSGNQVRNGDTLSFFELSFEELFSKIEKGFDEIAVKTLLSYANDISREGNGNCSRHILDQEIFKRIELLERIRAEIQSFIGRLQEDNEGGMVIPEREESKAKFLLSLQEKFDALYEKRSANFSIDAEESVIDIMLVDFVESLRKLTPTSDFKKMDTVGKLYLSRIDKMLDDVNGQLVITEQIHGDESQLLLLLRSTGLQRLKKQMEIFLLLFGPRKDSSVKNSLEEAGVTVNQLEKDYDEICSRLNNEMRTKFCDLIKARDVVLDALGSLFEPSFPELSFETGEE